MSFYDWCMKKYYGVNDLKGDLAEYMKCDSRFPKKSISKIEIEVYLMSKGLGEDLIKIFRGMYEREYIREIVCNRN